MKSIVADRGQVTIPQALRERLGIRPRTVLDFTEDHGRLIAVKLEMSDAVTRVAGCLKGKLRRTDDLMKDLRGDA